MKKSYNYSACAWYITALWMFIILIGIKNVIKIKLFYMKFIVSDKWVQLQLLLTGIKALIDVLRTEMSLL